MAKKPVKKATAKKSKVAKKTSTKRTGPAKKKSPVKSKKPLTDKERAFREANVIENSERKKKTGSTKRPKKSLSEQEAGSLLNAVIEGMRERKGKNIIMLNLQNIENRVTDYFVICDADSKTHVNSIAESVEETVMKMTGEKAYHSEGNQNGEWILIDYINVVAHVFLRETREHYNIEGLWGDAEITLIND